VDELDVRLTPTPLVMSKQSQLTFERAIRGGGGGRTEIVHWNYLVDGVSLRERLKVGDMVSPFGWLRPDADARFRQILLLKQASDLRPDRVPIFVCPECADYGCGAVTAAVSKEGDSIIWDLFAHENNYSDEAHPIAEHRQQRLSFHRSEYWSVIHALPLSASDTSHTRP
jgi:hypothetical protein